MPSNSLLPQDPLVLALDTSSSLGSLSLRRSKGVIVERAFEADHGHSQRLLPAIQLAFREAGIRLSDVGLLAAVTGPGSFTGLRVSLASLRGLAGERPCFGALTSDVAAWAMRGGQGSVLSLTDLFHGEVFGAVYDPDARRITPLEAGGIEDVLARLGSAAEACTVAAGSAAVRHRELLESRFRSLQVHELPEGLAPHLATLALAQASASTCVRATDLLPFYLRDPISRGLLDPRSQR